MEDYYKLLNINYDSTIDEINLIYSNKINYYKVLSFISNDDKIIIKKYKKAHFIFNNSEYKSIYDNYIKKNISNSINSNTIDLNDNIRCINNDTNKLNNNKGSIDQSLLYDRIFSINQNNTTNQQDIDRIGLGSTECRSKRRTIETVPFRNQSLIQNNQI